MGSEEPAQHVVIEEEEAVDPLRVSTTLTDTVMATTTTTTKKVTVMHTGLFSPQKRKRDASPLEIPETPWRLQHPISHDDDDEEEEEERVRVELDEGVVASGQVSPRSNKLVSQLSDLNLSGKLLGPPPPPQSLEITMTLEEEPPAAKKVKRRGRPANGKKKATITVDGNGDGSDEDLVTVAKRKGKGTLSSSGANGNGKEVVVGNTRRRLRSPPLPRTTGPDPNDNDGTAAVADESDDSDGPEQLGIGYKPTLMQRHARDRKRMQQVTYVPHHSPSNCGFFFFAEDVMQIKEYKARVSKEAREKRSETRRSRYSFPARYVSPVVGGAHSSEEGEKRKVVHFNLEPVAVDPVSEDAVTPEVLIMSD